MQAIEMRAKVGKNQEIRLRLPDDIQQHTVKVIIMYENESTGNQVMARRQFGQFKGKIQISDNFDESLPDNFWSGEIS
ncbi:MAG: hypothetical protein D3914_03160 [Candidatus Electrothrix sp. LOE2]|jgi:hypothetical protein|nr:hypothetical protein [Candidatus Electrothrix sp. LOE2]